MNSTDADCAINVPGLWHNGDCSLLCRPAKWSDILLFFLGNYIAHVATVTTPPGTSVLNQILSALLALLLPVSGASLGVEAILSGAIRGKTPLETAARAGALLIVVKSEVASDFSGSQANNEEGSQNEAPNSEQNTPPPLQYRKHTYRPWTSSKIHGNVQARLPDGYGVELVPYDIVFENDEKEVMPTRKKSKWYDFLFVFSKRKRNTSDIACSYNPAKVVVSIVQIAFSVVTLYQTKGNQIERFGYAAYGLTVTQYALMSAINLLGNLIRPTYPSMYIVGSKSTDTLHNMGCKIATVGRIKEEGDELSRQTKKKKLLERPEDMGQWIVPASFWAVVGLHLLVIGLMTNFRKEQSTLAQRVWTMFWHIGGGVLGIYLAAGRKNRFDTKKDADPVQDDDYYVDIPFLKPLFWLIPQSRKLGRRGLDGMTNNEVHGFRLAFVASLLSAPSIGGFVVVVQMIRHYGVCSEMLDASV